jgi:hypothetical protein
MERLVLNASPSSRLLKVSMRKRMASSSPCSIRRLMMKYEKSCTERPSKSTSQKKGFNDSGIFWQLFAGAFSFVWFMLDSGLYLIELKIYYNLNLISITYKGIEGLRNFISPRYMLPAFPLYEFIPTEFTPTLAGEGVLTSHSPLTVHCEAVAASGCRFYCRFSLPLLVATLQGEITI